MMMIEIDTNRDAAAAGGGGGCNGNNNPYGND